MILNKSKNLESKELFSSFVHRIGLSNIIAVSTLILTITTFYYQYWRVSYNVKATIIAVTPNYNGSLCATDIVFINTGNRQCSIAKLELEVNKSFKDNKYDGISVPIPCLNQTPFTINSNEVTTKQFKFGKGLLNFENSDPNIITPENADYSLVMYVVDAEGRCHKIKTFVMTTSKNKTALYDLTPLPKIVKLMPSPENWYRFSPQLPVK